MRAMTDMKDKLRHLVFDRPWSILVAIGCALVGILLSLIWQPLLLVGVIGWLAILIYVGWVL